MPKPTFCASCSSPSPSYQCPTCSKQNLPPAYFCSSECFKRSWKEHAKLHCVKAKKETTPVFLPRSPAPLRKQPLIPGNAADDVQFIYEKSPDGVDENLLVLFHGLGDTEKNFINFGRKMQLPQTALLAVRGLLAVPFFEGRSWCQGFDGQGDVLPPTCVKSLESLLSSRKVLADFFLRTVFPLGWEPSKVFLFGFSQGGTMALDLALFAGLGLGGVVSISGCLLDGLERPTQKHAFAKVDMDVPVLNTHGERDEILPLQLVRNKHADLLSLRRTSNPTLSRLVTIPDKTLCMPRSADEMRAIMEFFAQHLSRRNLALESMVHEGEVYEVAQGEQK